MCPNVANRGSAGVPVLDPSEGEDAGVKRALIELVVHVVDVDLHPLEPILEVLPPLSRTGGQAENVLLHPDKLPGLHPGKPGNWLADKQLLISVQVAACEKGALYVAC